MHKKRPYKAGIMKDGFTVMGLVLRMPNDDVLTGREVAWAQTQNTDRVQRGWSPRWAWIGEKKPVVKKVEEVQSPVEEVEKKEPKKEETKDDL